MPGVGLTDQPSAKPEERHLPSPLGRDVEMTMAKHTVKRAIYVGPALMLIFGLFRGVDGAIAAGVGVLIVVANFLLAGFLLSKSARISLSLYHAAALFGFFLRLGLIMLTMILIAQFIEIDKLAMGISAVVSYLVLLSWEALAVSKGAERELEWSS